MPVRLGAAIPSLAVFHPIYPSQSGGAGRSLPRLSAVRELGHILSRGRHAHIRLNTMPTWVPLAYCGSTFPAAAPYASYSYFTELQSH